MWPWTCVTIGPTMRCRLCCLPRVRNELRACPPKRPSTRRSLEQCPYRKPVSISSQQSHTRTTEQSAPHARYQRHPGRPAVVRTASVPARPNAPSAAPSRMVLPSENELDRMHTDAHTWLSVVMKPSPPTGLAGAVNTQRYTDKAPARCAAWRQ